MQYQRLVPIGIRQAPARHDRGRRYRVVRVGVGQRYRPYRIDEETFPHMGHGHIVVQRASVKLWMQQVVLGMENVTTRQPMRRPTAKRYLRGKGTESRTHAYHKSTSRRWKSSHTYSGRVQRLIQTVGRTQCPSFRYDRGTADMRSLEAQRQLIGVRFNGHTLAAENERTGYV